MWRTLQFLVTKLLPIFNNYFLINLSAIETSIEFFKDFEANYPETLKACYIINSKSRSGHCEISTDHGLMNCACYINLGPWVFSYIYGFIRPLLSARTLAKVQIFDSDVEKWQPIIYEQIPPESLPSNYGGTGPEFVHPEGYTFPTD